MGKVLVVDDDASVLRTLVAAMTRSGHAAIAAPNVKAAIALLESEPIDVALVDFHIGAESGLEVVRACRQHRGRNVFIVMLTGEDDDDTRAMAMAAGADLVLPKPVSPAELRAHVGQAMVQLRSAA